MFANRVRTDDVPDNKACSQPKARGLAVVTAIGANEGRADAEEREAVESGEDTAEGKAVTEAEADATEATDESEEGQAWSCGGSLRCMAGNSLGTRTLLK